LDENPLTLCVARGTDVLAHHESALNDLCSSPGSNDKEIEDCVVDYLNSGYGEDAEDVDEKIQCEDDNDTECVIENMYKMWSSELTLPPTTPEIADQPEEAKAKAKPWSSYSDY
jgi:hypothetical protein